MRGLVARTRALVRHLLACLLLCALLPAASLSAAETLTPSSPLERYPISPPDTSSPRATIESFLLVMQEAERLWVGARRSLASRPGSAPTDAERRAIELAGVLLNKAMEVFDFSRIPKSAVENDSLVAVLQFKEILDRIAMPDLETIPGAPAGSFTDSKAQRDLPASWTIPYTDLTIVRQDSGDQIGRFLVSARTVERIDNDYRIIVRNPVRADTGTDLFEFHRRSPGGLMPPAWFTLIENGPDWLQQDRNGQPLWKWLGRMAALVVFVSIPVLVHLWMRRRPTPETAGARGLRRLLLPLVVVLCIYGFRYVVREEINLTGPWTHGVTMVTEAIIWTVAAWCVYQGSNALSAWLLESRRMKTDTLDSSLLRTGLRIFGLCLAVLILGYGATQIGIPVYGVVAGLGIGGLAIALAAQPTMENLIGGVILYADQVLRVGDFCRLGTLTGTVETIGIRSTRIRALDKTLITVANADLVKMQIVNFSRRDCTHLHTVLGLRYETTPEQLRQILRQLHELLAGHPKVLEQDLRVRFIAFGPHSLDIEIFAYVATPARPEFLAIQEDIFLSIIDLVEAAGSGFAFPSTTAYLARDPGIDKDRPARPAPDVAAGEREKVSAEPA